VGRRSREGDRRRARQHQGRRAITETGAAESDTGGHARRQAPIDSGATRSGHAGADHRTNAIGGTAATAVGSCNRTARRVRVDRGRCCDVGRRAAETVAITIANALFIAAAAQHASPHAISDARSDAGAIALASRSGGADSRRDRRGRNESRARGAGQLSSGL